jgi:hypothetical protein
VISIQNYWVSGLCPSSRILNTRTHNVSETGCFRPQVREGDTFSAPVGSLTKRVNLNHWITPIFQLTESMMDIKTKRYVP